MFEDGHHLNANGPIALETGTRLCHLAFIADPQLPARDTANGHLQFLQLVGLTDEEMEAVKRWSTRGVLQALQPAMPLWISDLHRGNLLEDPTLAAQVRAGSEREGSSTGMLFIETLDWRQEAGVTTLVLGAGQVASVCELLPLRLRHGNRWNWPAASGSGNSFRQRAVNRRGIGRQRALGTGRDGAAGPGGRACRTWHLPGGGSAAHRSGADLPARCQR